MSFERLIASNDEAFSNLVEQVKPVNESAKRVGLLSIGFEKLSSSAFLDSILIALPEPRKKLKKQISSQIHLGETKDGKQIYLYQHGSRNTVLKEIGRLREIAFRAVGEGTGKRRDIDQYDASYSQLVLWDEHDQEIVGAYRLALAKDIIQTQGVEGLYSASLFEYHEDMLPILEQGAELGRSFVQPKYWGKRSLDYLWYGIGSFLSQNPHVRYLFGPVSLSNDMPKPAKDLMVYFFTLYFGQPSYQRAFLENASSQLSRYKTDLNETPCLAKSKQPYRLSSELVNSVKHNFSGEDYKQDFKTLKHILSNMGCSVPTLFKQYSELCEPGGLVFLDFGIDAAFSGCIDGLVVVDVSRIKAKKRARYISDNTPCKTLEREKSTKRNRESTEEQAVMSVSMEG